MVSAYREGARLTYVQMGRRNGRARQPVPKVRAGLEILFSAEGLELLLPRLFVGELLVRLVLLTGVADDVDGLLDLLSR